MRIDKGEEKSFKASLQVTRYTHRFIVDVNGRDIIFEPDEERNYRAVLNYEDTNNITNIDRELLKAISNVIDDILN